MRKLFILITFFTLLITFNGFKEVSAYQYSDDDITWSLNSKRFLYDDEKLSVTLLAFNQNILENFQTCISVYELNENGERIRLLNGKCFVERTGTIEFNFNEVAIFDEDTFIRYEVVTQLYYFDIFNVGGPSFGGDDPYEFPMFRGTVIKRPPAAFYFNPNNTNNLSVGVNTSVYTNTQSQAYLFETAGFETFVTMKNDFAIIHYSIPEADMNFAGLELYSIYINDIITGDVVANINLYDFIHSQLPDTGPQTIINSFNNGYIFINLNGDSSASQFFSFVNGSILIYYLEAITYGNNPYKLNLPIGVYTYGITDHVDYFKQGETPLIVSQFNRELIDISFRNTNFPLGATIGYRVRRFEPYVWQFYDTHDLIINNVDYSNKFVDYKDITDITFKDNINTTTQTIEHFIMTSLTGDVFWGLNYSEYEYSELGLITIYTTYTNTTSGGVGELPAITDDELALNIYNVLSVFNLADEYGKFIISLFIYAFIYLFLILIKSNNFIFVLATLFITSILTALAFLPLWFIVLMAFFVAYGFLKTFNAGGDSSV